MNPNYLELENNYTLSKNYIGYKKNKIEKQKNNFQYVKSSFTITYIFLLTTATITFIEAMRTNSLVVRHVMNLETAISVIAGYFYSTFVEDIKKCEADNKVIDWANISIIRYLDWSMTTPIMLLVLCLVLSHNIQKKVTFKVISGVIILNYIMLYLGYLGEVKYIDRLHSMFFGFIAFFGLFYLIFANYVAPKFVKANYILFSFFTIIWAFYGIVFMFNEEYKNIAMNILDCISKCLVGIGFWLYFTKIIVL
jgi:bacteriorhodopsin